MQEYRGSVGFGFKVGSVLAVPVTSYIALITGNEACISSAQSPAFPIRTYGEMKSIALHK